VLLVEKVNSFNIAHVIGLLAEDKDIEYLIVVQIRSDLVGRVCVKT
jgi:hypothetical protein